MDDGQLVPDHIPPGTPSPLATALAAGYGDAVLLDAPMVAALLRVEEATVRLWAREGRIGSVRLGSGRSGPVRFTRGDVAEYIARNGHEPRCWTCRRSVSAGARGGGQGRQERLGWARRPAATPAAIGAACALRTTS